MCTSLCPLTLKRLKGGSWLPASTRLFTAAALLATAPFTTYLLSLNVNVTPLCSLSPHCHLQQRAFCGRGLCPLHCCVIWLHLHLHLTHPTSRRQSCQPPACPGGKSDLAAAEKSSCLLEQIQSSCKRGDRCDTL